MENDRDTELKLKSLLQGNTVKIVRVIEGNLLVASLELKTKGIIPDSLYRKVVHAHSCGVDPLSLAAQVETSVSTTLQVAPHLFLDFVKIVTDLSPDFGRLLERKYRGKRKPVLHGTDLQVGSHCRSCSTNFDALIPLVHYYLF